MTTATTIVNQAIYLIGNDQPLVTGVYPTFDDSAAGKAAAQLYGPCVQTVARQFEWDFERNFATLSASGNTPPIGWSHEYLYPTNGIEVWQLIPPSPDPLNPLPLNWSVGNVLVSSVPTKVIWSNTAGVTAVFANQPGPDVWDPLFREAVVRLLSSELAIAVAGKPDTARDLLEQAGGFTQTGMSRDD